MVFLALAASQSQATITYSADLKCGKCIKGGYNFCFKGADTQTFDSEAGIESTCCQDSTCTQASDSAWTCSSSYSDPDYAITFCPFKKNKCGTTQKVEFNNETNTAMNLTVQSLEAGDTCAFMIKSKCNSPAFSKKDAQGMNDSNVELSFIEYEKSFLNATELDQRDGTEDKNSRKWKMPDDDRPPRNQSWKDMGQLNKTLCKSKEWAADTNITAFKLRYGKAYAVKVTKDESTGIYTITVCSRGQFKPKRKFKFKDGETEQKNFTEALKEKEQEVQQATVAAVMQSAHLSFGDLLGSPDWADVAAHVGQKDLLALALGSTTTQTSTTENKGWGKKYKKTYEDEEEEYFKYKYKKDYTKYDDTQKSEQDMLDATTKEEEFFEQKNEEFKEETSKFEDLKKKYQEEKANYEQKKAESDNPTQYDQQNSAEKTKLDKLKTVFDELDTEMTEAQALYEEKKANIEASKALYEEKKAYKEKVSQNGYAKTQADVQLEQQFEQRATELRTKKQEIKTKLKEFREKKQASDIEYEKTSEPDKSEPDAGYGMPSKGKYSLDLGGYKTFGTEGQGNSTVGVKNDGAATCSERILLFTVTATADTTTTSPTVQSSRPHPIVQSSSSSMTFQVGNYQFIDDYTGEPASAPPPQQEAAAPAEQEEDNSGVILHATMVMAAFASLVVAMY